MLLFIATNTNQSYYLTVSMVVGLGIGLVFGGVLYTTII